MEKLVFMFRRKPGATRESFFEHYIDAHAPLGMRHKQGLDGYTVNMLDSEADFDVLTEIWTPSIAGFTGSGSMTDGDRAIIADHISFMGPQDAYAVEERIVRGGALPSFVPLTRAEGAKAVSFFHVGEPLPEPGAGARRVIDNVVKTAIYRRDQRIDRAPAEAGDLAVIRTFWAASAEELGALPPGSLLVREFRNREAV